MVCLSGHEAYALHSSYDRAFNRYCVTDMLLEQATEYARSHGAVTFNMGASPAGQPKLVEFKEKWGGVTHELYTYEWPLSPLMASGFKLAKWTVTMLTKAKQTLRAPKQAGG